MTSPYYTVTGYPQTGAPGASAPMRGELLLIQAAFQKFPDYTAGAARQAVVVNSGLTGFTLTDKIAYTDTTPTFTAGMAIQGAVTVTHTVGANGTVQAEGFFTGSYVNATAANATWYTAIPAATFASVQGTGRWDVIVICENAAAYAGLITVPTTGSPVVTLTQLAAGTYATAQIDGSGNFQVQQNSGSTQTITAIWKRMGL